MVLERWNLVCLLVEMSVKTMALALWRYLKNLGCRVHFSLKENYLTEFSKQRQTINNLRLAP